MKSKTCKVRFCPATETGQVLPPDGRDRLSCRAALIRLFLLPAPLPVLQAPRVRSSVLDRLPAGLAGRRRATLQRPGSPSPAHDNVPEARLASCTLGLRLSSGRGAGEAEPHSPNSIPAPRSDQRIRGRERA